MPAKPASPQPHRRLRSDANPLRKGQKKKHPSPPRRTRNQEPGTSDARTSSPPTCVPAMPDKPPPLPVAVDRLAISNRLSMLLADRSALARKLLVPRSSGAPRQPPGRGGTRLAAAAAADDDDGTSPGAPANQGVGYVPERAGRDAKHEDNKALRARMLGKRRGRERGRGRESKGDGDSESDDVEGRGSLGRRKRPRRGEAGDGDGDGDGTQDRAPRREDACGDGPPETAGSRSKRERRRRRKQKTADDKNDG
ncbi:uncharacterized protein MAM_02918 [Metarhizium album ARSEF 1941]|uniref:Uncharacterized protein n=1 Tax=Metarhizium album (strain ARSEF 1941) TaxID=1081103 RepID=A0A0B2X207_METAS|nr:uncharacterized protein MAM_02918 [Metarhizium album ARSEF 1941]KHN99220.1 hypothetical protein MAM_02918 [Metarhizium album ARSEF 1941]